MAISVTDPINLAIKKTREILFTPFDAMKWFKLGLAAFLVNLGSGGGGGFNCNPGFNGGGSGKFGNGNFGGGNPLDQIRDALQQNLILVIGIGLGILIGVTVIVLIVTWLTSYGQFMFIDGIVKNRGAVREPWSDYTKDAKSLFKFLILWALIGMLFMIVLFGVCGVLVWIDMQAHSMGVFSIIAAIILVVFGLLGAIVGGVVRFLLIDFVVPTMYKRRVSCMEAWHIVRAEFMPHKTTILLFMVMWIALAFGLGIITSIVTMCLCCIPAIPYIGAVILLPIFVFSKCYSLYFLEQFGPEWQFFAPPITPEQAPIAAEVPPGWENNAL